MLTGCLKEGDSGCPADMRLSFRLEDAYEAGTYDTRIANDVLLYIFRDKRCVESILIPYAEIQSEKEYVIRKNELYGSLDLVAWAVPAGVDDQLIPAFENGKNLGDCRLELNALTRVEDYEPYVCDLYLGRVSTNETIDVETSHKVDMIHSSCRVEVNVIDVGTSLSSGAADPKVCVYGSMHQMDMDKNGMGNVACVNTSLGCPSGDGTSYSTGRFGILPSTSEQVLSVEIYNGSQLLATLSTPTNSDSPISSAAGGLIVFDYVLGEAYFWLTVGDYREKIEIIKGI